ncbi:MAG: winged helix-turn-helix transcriptional regulator [Thermoplasmatota archaeon]
MSYVPEADALEHPIRALILRFVERHPGIRLTELSVCLGLENSTLLWHLRKLQSADLIHRLGSPRARVYWAQKAGKEGKDTARRVSVLNTERKRAVLSTIVAQPGIRMIDAAPQIGITAAVARQVANLLEEADLATRIEQPGGHAFHPGAQAAAALEASMAIQEALQQAGKSTK